MSKVFTPFRIKSLTLANRLVMPPMALDHAAEDGEVTTKLFEHYRLRAQHHATVSKPSEARSFQPTVGMIIIEHAYVCAGGKAHPRQVGIHQDRLIPGLHLLAEEIRNQGVAVGIQLNHAGARAIHSPAGPSGLALPYLARYGQERESAHREVPKEFGEQEIGEITAAFAQAARRAQKAGFDFLEIHGAHGYLLNQFYSPLTNQRRDNYGGTLEQRLKFPLEVIRAVREAVGPIMPVFYRLGADDRILGGNTVEDSIRAVPMLEKAGIDCLDLSGGIGGYLKKGPEGFFHYLAEAVRPVTNLPLLVTGGITQAWTAENLLRTGTVDLVGIGRALLADPQWVSKAWEELESKVWLQKAHKNRWRVKEK